VGYTVYNKINRMLIDGLITGLGFYLAYQIRFDANVDPFGQYQFWLLLAPVVVGRLFTSALFGLNKHQWRYVSTVDAIRVAAAYASFSVVLLALRLGFAGSGSLKVLCVPIGVITIEFLLTFLGAIGVRMLRRFLYQWQPGWKAPEEERRLLLVGAGSHGSTVAKEMAPNKGLKVVGFVDDDPAKLGSVIAGVKVLGSTRDIPKIVKAHYVDDILICVPPASRGTLKLGGGLNERSVRTRIVPTLGEILQDGAEAEDPFDVPANGHAFRARPRVSAPENLSTTLRDKTILITGGAGFIGSSLAEKLAPTNKVILVDTEFSAKPVNFTSLLQHPNVSTVQGDIVEGLDMSAVCKDVNMVVHAAAIVGVSRVCGSGRETLETNYIGTSQLLKAVEGNKRLERFVYFSTSEVFGVNSFRVDENSPPSVGPIAESRWSYAIAKLAGEHLVKSYFREADMPTVIVRPFNIFGPKRTGDHALLRFILNALAGRPIEVHGDGSQIRSWCYIEDFCAALLGMLEKPEAVGEDFNIGHPGNTLTIYRLAERVVDITGSKSPIHLVEQPFPDIGIRVPSLTKAQNVLGYRPRYDLDSALTLTVDWYRRHWDFFADRFGAAPVAASASRG
jgi:nucleoside-diphosphate-sugar epimerase